jgi:hypothetical protein
MLDQKTTHTTTAERVEESARKLFGRINPPVRDRDIPGDAPILPIYDWEIAGDAELDLEAVRTALETLDGRAIALETVNQEHIIIGLTQGSGVEDAA